MFRIFIVSLVMLTNQLSAVIYTADEISASLYNQQNKSTQDFIREFFVAKDPQAYIDNLLSNHKKSREPIVLEHNLYSLLTEVAYHPKQTFLQTFINQMKVFNVLALKMHDEGSMSVAIYNINAKAKGIENIWLADESFYQYQSAFADNPIATLEQLRNNIHNLKSPQWLGLKNSIETISKKNHILLSDYLLKDNQNRVGLNKFVSHYALLTSNKSIVIAGLQSLDKSNSEYLLRNLASYFSVDFVVSQLISSIENNNNQKFAISMMASYLEDPMIQQKLIGYLSIKKLATSAAISLIQTKEVDVIHQLESLYAKSDSSHVKKQILFTLKMNQMIESKTALKRISNQFDSHSKSAQWLSSFQGEIK
jgi:hypothetical protein